MFGGGGSYRAGSVKDGMGCSRRREAAHPACIPLLHKVGKHRDFTCRQMKMCPIGVHAKSAHMLQLLWLKNDGNSPGTTLGKMGDIVAHVEYSGKGGDGAGFWEEQGQGLLPH